VRYERYKSDEIVVDQNIYFVNLKSAIATELKMDELRKKLKFRYIIEVKKQDPRFSMYLLCIDTTNKIKRLKRYIDLMDHP